MSRYVGRARFSLAVLAMAVLAIIDACGIARAENPPATLVEPHWQPQTDAQGMQWMIDPHANLQVNGGQTMLMQAGALTVNGQQFSPQRVQMTPDGHEYVFEGVTNNMNGMANTYSPYMAPNPYGYAQPVPYAAGAAVQTTRRIKLDLATSTVRFVESFQNTAAAPQQVNVMLISSMRTILRSTVSGPSGTSLDAATGQPLAGAAAGGVAGLNMPYRPPFRSGNVRLSIPERDCGIAITAGAGNFPAVFFYLPGTRSFKPAIDIENMHVVRASFNVTVPAQSTVSVVWGLSQPKVAALPDERQMKDQFKIFQDRKWLAGLPDGVIKSIANLHHEPASGAMGPLLQPVLELAARFNIQRGKDNVLVQDEQVRLNGTASGGTISVATALGKVSLPLADVAVLCGGGGIDRPMRVYLRNGEILLGRIEAKDLVLKSANGGNAKLPPEKINLLFFHSAGDDGKAPAEAGAMLLTHDGQRLLVGGDARFHAISPWGELDVGLGEIASLTSRSEPQPLFQMALLDGSNLSVVLEGESPAVKTLRFGPVPLATVGLRQLWSLKAPPAKKAEEDDAPGIITGPHCRLIGDNVLAGTLDTPQLMVATAGGVLGFAASSVQNAQRSGDAAAGGRFQIELTDGRQVAGTLANRTVSMQFHGKTWEIPGPHVVGIAGRAKVTAAARKAVQKSGPGEQSGEDGKPLPNLPMPPVSPPGAVPAMPDATAPSYYTPAAPAYYIVPPVSSPYAPRRQRRPSQRRRMTIRLDRSEDRIVTIGFSPEGTQVNSQGREPLGLVYKRFMSPEGAKENYRRSAALCVFVFFPRGWRTLAIDISPLRGYATAEGDYVMHSHSHYFHLALYCLLLFSIVGTLPAAAVAQPAALVPAQFAPFHAMTDSQGFLWDVDQMGRVMNGSDSCFSQSFTLLINNAQFQPASAHDR